MACPQRATVHDKRAEAMAMWEYQKLGTEPPRECGTASKRWAYDGSRTCSEGVRFEVPSRYRHSRRRAPGSPRVRR
jgi:hypothetical protein